MATKPANPEPDTGSDAPEEALPDGLWPKLLLAQQAVDVVAKEGRNTFHGYDYAKAEDVIRHSARALQGAGLVAFVRLDPEGVTETPGQTNDGKQSLAVTVRGHLVVKDPGSGEEAEFDLYGTGIDTPGDKAYYKAMTGGKKYAYASALQIGFGDDPEEGESPGGKATYAAAAELPAWARPAAEAQVARVQAALELLCELPGEEAEATKARAEAVMETIVTDEGAGSQLTRAAARAVLHAAARVKADAESAAAEEPVPWEAPAEGAGGSSDADDDAPAELPPMPERKQHDDPDEDLDPVEEAERQLDHDAVLDDPEGGDAPGTE